MSNIYKAVIVVVIAIAIIFGAYQYSIKSDLSDDEVVLNNEAEKKENINTGNKEIESNNWPTKTYEAEGYNIVLKVPTKNRFDINTELVNREIDEIPENFSLSTIGGQVFDKKNIEIKNYTVTSYNFTTAVGYQWYMVEIPVDTNVHIELGYTYKNIDDSVLTEDEWYEIVSSIEVDYLSNIDVPKKIGNNPPNSNPAQVIPVIQKEIEIANVPKSDVVVTADLSIDGEDEILNIPRGSYVDLKWSSVGADRCDINAVLDGGAVSHSYYDLEPQGILADVFTENKDIYIPNWTSSKWLVFYLKCYADSNPNNKVEDIVSILLKPNAEREIQINSPSTSTLKRLDNIRISWNSSPEIVEKVDILLISETGETEYLASSIKNDGYYYWTVNDHYRNESYKIVVSEPTGGPERGSDETGWFKVVE